MQYNPSLDGLRAVAVLLVVASHAQVVLGGYIGVDIFFVLSGFLITSIIIDQSRAGAFAYFNFYKRRFLRLTPPLLLMLAFYLVTAPSIWPDTPMREHFRDAAVSALYLSDYAKAYFDVPDILRHTWSLAVEEHFYLIWPVVAVLLARCSDAAACRALILLFVVATVWRQFQLNNGHSIEEAYYRFDTHASGLIIGSAAAFFARRVAISGLTARGLGVLAAGYLAWQIPTLKWFDARQMHTTMVYVEIAAVMLVLSLHYDRKSDIGRLLSIRPVVYLGKLSYGIYLYHAPISFYMRLFDSPALNFLVTVPLSIAFAAFSYHTIEADIRRKRESADQGKGASEPTV